ncbi:MAG: S8 family serine peptidase [Rothia sp. (in: high G+C Gram-positive bacteria)]|nr:S8 family serine peptidase [Rothia sp. (in: high G+C Gram-positive bacteria)]
MKKQHKYTAKIAKAGIASSLGVVLALTLGMPAYATSDPDLASQNSHPNSVLTPSIRNAQGNVAAFVQFKGPGAFEATQPVNVRTNNQTPVKATAAVKAIASDVQNKADSVASQANANILYTTHNALRGVAIQGDAKALKELAKRSDVVKISKIVPKSPSNAGTVVDTKALASWTSTNKTGKGVRIAIVDSGIDYTHADLGGPGTQEAYEKASASNNLPATNSGLFDPAKFVGGYDFAGDGYDAGGKNGSNVPTPDNNPLDCREGGHGSHVSGTAAGYGVGEDGKTFKGDYTKLTEEQVKKMQIGPGSAPQAQLIGLRVFGCEGTTNVVGEALDRTLDPNGDGDFSDRANIVNLSLGSDFGVTDDPENDMIEALTRQGLLSVIAAGNANNYSGVGDTYSNLGNPPNAISALTVANSIGSTFLSDKSQILSPADIAGEVSGDYSSNFDYNKATDAQLTGTVVAAPADNKYACDAFPAGTDFKGKWVLIDWYDSDTTFPCGSAKRFNNIEAAGGKGVVLTSRHETEDTGIAGNATIPGTRLNVSDSAKAIKATVNSGSFQIKLKAEWREAMRKPTGALDTINSSTARGPHGSNGFTKPDVAAPGTSIKSLGVGKGNGATVMSGTSMATPHVAGVAALVLEAHQNYSPANIKAAIMNTATHDLKTVEGTVYAVDRVGSGRIDAQAAINDQVLVYNSDNEKQVSQSFGVVEVKPNDQRLVLKRKFTVDNFSSQAHNYAVKYDGSVTMPGVNITVDPAVSVAAGSKAEFTVTATVDPAALQKTADPALMTKQLNIARQYIAQASGRIKLTENGTELRVPVQIAPKPVSDMTAKVAQNGNASKVTLSGIELNQGGYVGLLGAFELGAKSPRINTVDLPVASAQRSDLQYVGASSNAPLLVQAGKSTNDAVMGVGVSTWANWDVIADPNSVEVSIDVDGNQRPDYFLASTRQLDKTGTNGLDLPMAGLYGYVNGKVELLSISPINGETGDVDTNLMDSNTMVLPVKLSDLGITADNADKVSYKVDTYSWYADGALDSTDWIKYNPLKPQIAFAATEQTAANLYKDSASTQLAIARDPKSTASALFLHLHNGTGDLSGIKKGEDGGKAQVIDFAATEPTNPTPSEKPFDARFTDVKQSDMFYKEINWLAQERITTGWSDGTFRPQDNVERASMAAFLYRMSGSPQFTPPTVSPFKDVPTTDPFYKEITWMYAQGITTGWPDGTFHPHDSVARDQMAAFFYRMAGSPEYNGPVGTRFVDVKAETPFAKEISWLAEQNITNGWDEGTFRPTQPIKRDAMAAFLYRYAHNVK